MIKKAQRWHRWFFEQQQHNIFWFIKAMVLTPVLIGLIYKDGSPKNNILKCCLENHILFA